MASDKEITRLDDEITDDDVGDNKKQPIILKLGLLVEDSYDKYQTILEQDYDFWELLLELDLCGKSVLKLDISLIPDRYTKTKLSVLIDSAIEFKKRITNDIENVALDIDILLNARLKKMKIIQSRLNSTLAKVIESIRIDRQNAINVTPIKAKLFKANDPKVVEAMKILNEGNPLEKFDDWPKFIIASQNEVFDETHMEILRRFIRNTIAYITSGGKGQFITRTKRYDGVEILSNGERKVKWDITLIHSSSSEFYSSFQHQFIFYLDDVGEKTATSFSDIIQDMIPFISYGHFKFVPTNEPIEDTYNLFTRFIPDRNEELIEQFRNMYSLSIKEQKELMKEFLPIYEHLYYKWAAGNYDHYKYIITWLAYMIQKAEDMHGVYLFIEGEQGSGKSCIAKWIRDYIIGESYSYITANAKDFFSNFNAASAFKIFCCLEEASIKGGEMYRLLKQNGTATKISVTFKCKDAFIADSYMHLMLFGNPEQRQIKEEYKGRRMSAYSMNTSGIKNGTQEHFEYMERLHNNLNSVSAYHFFNYLLSINLNEINIHNIPNTDLRRIIISESIPSIIKFFKYLIDGQISKYIPKGDKDDKKDLGVYSNLDSKVDTYPYPSTELLKKYNLFIDKNNTKNKSITSNEFIRQIKQYKLGHYTENKIRPTIMYPSNGIIIGKENKLNADRYIIISISYINKLYEDALNGKDFEQDKIIDEVLEKLGLSKKEIDDYKVEYPKNSSDNSDKSNDEKDKKDNNVVKDHPLPTAEPIKTQEEDKKRNLIPMGKVKRCIMINKGKQCEYAVSDHDPERQYCYNHYNSSKSSDIEAPLNHKRESILKKKIDDNTSNIAIMKALEDNHHRISVERNGNGAVTLKRPLVKKTPNLSDSSENEDKKDSDSENEDKSENSDSDKKLIITKQKLNEGTKKKLKKINSILKKDKNLIKNIHSENE